MGAVKFDSLVDEFFEDLLREAPVLASKLGVDGYDDELGDFSEQGFQRRNDNVDSWTQRFEALDAESLDLNEEIDRGLILSNLRGSKIMRDWESHKRNPGTYLDPGLSGVFTLFLNRLKPESELAGSAVERMRKIPETLASGRKNLDAKLASPLFVERAIGQCRAGIAYFRHLVPAEIDDPADQKKVSEAGEEAAKAYEEFASFLEDLKKSADGPWAIGENRYSALLKDKEMLGYGAMEMHERGQAAFDSISTELSKVSHQISGSEDWRGFAEGLKKDHPTSPEEMRKEYEEWTERARAFLIEKDLVTLPEGESCLVEPSPPFQRPILAVASYSSPPAFKPSRTGHFFVPYPPDGASDQEIQSRLEASNRNEIPTTAVHEAYPGHHWHIVVANENPRKIRRVLGTSYFVEGWALYAEKMMYEEGLYTNPKHAFGYLESRIFRAARIVVDTALHTGRMTFDEAVDFMLSTNVVGAEPTVKAEVGRYCSWPTQAPSYLTGSLEIERMRERFFAEKRGSLKEFNNRVAATGFLPIGLAEKALFASR